MSFLKKYVLLCSNKLFQIEVWLTVPSSLFLLEIANMILEKKKVLDWRSSSVVEYLLESSRHPQVPLNGDYAFLFAGKADPNNHTEAEITRHK